MSVFPPLLFLSLLTMTVLVAWERKGPGAAGPRTLITVSLVFSLLLSWEVLLSVGAFHPVGSWAIGAAFVITILGLIVPILYRSFIGRSL